MARTLRAIRRRRRLSQREVGALLGISQQEFSRREREPLNATSIEFLERWADILGGRVILDLRLDGERPLLDSRHALIQNWLTGYLRRAGWAVAAEVSFNHYGDRGRIDLLAFHPALRILLVVEVKTRLDDVQDLLGRLDIKLRVSVDVARRRGWLAVVTSPAVVFPEDRTIRRRIESHAALFARFDLRTRRAMSWLLHPSAPIPRGLMVFVAAVRSKEDR